MLESKTAYCTRSWFEICSMYGSFSNSLAVWFIGTTLWESSFLMKLPSIWNWDVQEGHWTITNILSIQCFFHNIDCTRFSFALLFNWTNQKNLHFWSLMMSIHASFNWMLESLCCLPREAIENFLRTLLLLILEVILMTHFFIKQFENIFSKRVLYWLKKCFS